MTVISLSVKSLSKIIFTPKHPKTKPTVEEIEKENKLLDGISLIG